MESLWAKSMVGSLFRKPFVGSRLPSEVQTIGNLMNPMTDRVEIERLIVNSITLMARAVYRKAISSEDHG